MLHQRHSYIPVDSCVGAIPRSAVLAKQTFQNSLNQDSMPFKEIVSTVQTADWWSPQACQINSPTCDLQLVRDCAADFSRMRMAWLGGSPYRHSLYRLYLTCASDIVHVHVLQTLVDMHMLTLTLYTLMLFCLIFIHHALLDIQFFLQTSCCQTKPGMLKEDHIIVFAKSADDTRFYYPGKQVGDSSVLCWPLARKTFPGSNVVWFQPLSAKTVCLVTVVDLNQVAWVGCRVSWRFWIWQWHTYPQVRTNMIPGIRLAAEGEMIPISKLAATCAYWHMPKNELTEFALYRGISLEVGLSIF